MGFRHYWVLELWEGRLYSMGKGREMGEDGGLALGVSCSGWRGQSLGWSSRRGLG